jgi:hypothetical protein
MSQERNNNQEATSFLADPSAERETARKADRLTCERIVAGDEPCGATATLAVKIKPEWPHSPNCQRAGKCKGHPVCEGCAFPLRAEGVVERIKDYPIRPPRSAVSGG